MKRAESLCKLAPLAEGNCSGSSLWSQDRGFATNQLLEFSMKVSYMRIGRVTRVYRVQSEEVPVSGKVLQIKAHILDIEPPIWRRIVIPDSFSLESLHLVLQGVFGWENSHLHAFEIEGVRYGPADDPDWGIDLESERDTLAGSVLRAGMVFSYLYDFGDDWRHELVIEKVLDEDPGTMYPVCLGGARACPPEDCGGPWGYQALLEVISDSRHPDHEEMIEWVGSGFDPEAFAIPRFGR